MTVSPDFAGTSLINYAEITSDDGDDRDSIPGNTSTDEDDDDFVKITVVPATERVSLAGVIYHDYADAAGDDQYGSGDVGVAGQTVVLTDQNGTVVATTQTASDGSYLFENLQPGTYTVSYTNSSTLTADSVQPGSTGGTPS